MRMFFKKVINALKEKGTSLQRGQIKENSLTMKTKTKFPKKPPASEFGIKAQPLCFSYSLHTVMFTEPHSEARGNKLLVFKPQPTAGGRQSCLAERESKYSRISFIILTTKEAIVAAT